MAPKHVNPSKQGAAVRDESANAKTGFSGETSDSRRTPSSDRCGDGNLLAFTGAWADETLHRTRYPHNEDDLCMIDSAGRDLKTDIEILDLATRDKKRITDTKMSPLEWYLQDTQDCSAAERLFRIANGFGR